MLTREHVAGDMALEEPAALVRFLPPFDQVLYDCECCGRALASRLVAFQDADALEHEARFLVCEWCVADVERVEP